MQKIEVKDNPLKLDVYINGTPDLSLIPNDLMDSFVTALTKEIIKIVNEKNDTK